MKLFSLPNLCLIIGISILSFSCKEKEDVTLKALESYKITLDNHIDTFEKEEITVKESINESTINNQDTFALAKTLIPIKTTKFLLESKYDELTTTIKDYQNNKIDAQQVKEILQSQKEYVENLLSENSLN